MIETVKKTGSTNADLLARLTAGERVPEGNWLVADRQSAGRGRQGREWFDGSGNFMGSTVVRTAPTDPPAHSLALVAGLAAYEAIAPFCSDGRGLMLKWPNDVMLKGAKLCGILLESSAAIVVVGIGVNLARAPVLTDRKTMALSELGPTPDRDTFAGNLASAFDQELERWRTYGLEPLIRRWLAVGTPRGTVLSVHEPDGSIVSGSFDGLDPQGTLQLRLEDGTVRAIHAGDVFLN